MLEANEDNFMEKLSSGGAMGMNELGGYSRFIFKTPFFLKIETYVFKNLTGIPDH